MRSGKKHTHEKKRTQKHFQSLSKNVISIYCSTKTQKMTSIGPAVRKQLEKLIRDAGSYSKADWEIQRDAVLRVVTGKEDLSDEDQQMVETLQQMEWPAKKMDAVKSDKKTKSTSMTKTGAKRHRKLLRDTIQGVTKPALRRLARRAGIKRISGLLYEELRGTLKTHILEPVLRDAVTYMEHARRKTVTAQDVVYAGKRHGSTVYGF